jgi:hypothetical protein
MKYVSGPYFEPDFDPLLYRFGTPGYARVRFVRGEFSLSISFSGFDDCDERLCMVSRAGSSLTMRRARTARSSRFVCSSAEWGVEIDCVRFMVDLMGFVS